MYDNVFKIDYNKLVVELLPTRLRKARHIAFLQLLVRPYKIMLQELRVHREVSLYKISHDSRTGSIEKVLNDSFDALQRRIRIRAPKRGEPTYIYSTAENRPTFTPFFVTDGSEDTSYANELKTYVPQFTPFYVYTEKEVAASFVDFVVYIPADLGLAESDLIRLDSLVRYYALKDKTFKIEQL